MIFDNIKKIALYDKLSENIKMGLDFLESHSQDDSLEAGEYILKEKEVIAYVVEKTTQAQEETNMEYHDCFIDIHYIMKGQEYCGLAPMDYTLKDTDYNEEKDLGFLAEVKDSSGIIARQGDFYIVWPHEPHRPLCTVGEKCEEIKKIILKVKA